MYASIPTSNWSLFLYGAIWRAELTGTKTSRAGEEEDVMELTVGKEWEARAVKTLGSTLALLGPFERIMSMDFLRGHYIESEGSNNYQNASCFTRVNIKT
jgi:hypothetical protein